MVRDMMCDVVFTNLAESVCAKCNQKRSIVIGHRIEVDADCEHLRQDGFRGCNMEDALFDGPWSEPWQIASLAHDNSAVLMPAKRPVGCVIFIE